MRESQAVNGYLKGSYKNLPYRSLQKIATVVDLTVEELINPARPVLNPSHFCANLKYLIERSERTPTTIAKACGISWQGVFGLLRGSQRQFISLHK